MLPIDHLPFPGPDPEALARAFERLGFHVSPRGAYVSPEGGRWRNRAIFLEQGWFDLLAEPQAAAGAAAPFAALFLASDLDAAALALEPVKTSKVFSLERRWDTDIGRAPETFRYRNVQARVAPIPLSVIEHAWPCVDVLPQWREHLNTACRLVGIVFGDGEPGPAAQAVGELLDLTGFAYVDPAVFAARYGSPQQALAVRIEVRSLAAAAESLAARRTAFEAGETLIVRAPEGFGCSFEFLEHRQR